MGKKTYHMYPLVFTKRFGNMQSSTTLRPYDPVIDKLNRALTPPVNANVNNNNDADADESNDASEEELEGTPEDEDDDEDDKVRLSYEGLTPRSTMPSLTESATKCVSTTSSSVSSPLCCVAPQRLQNMANDASPAGKHSVVTASLMSDTPMLFEATTNPRDCALSRHSPSTCTGFDDDTGTECETRSLPIVVVLTTGTGDHTGPSTTRSSRRSASTSHTPP
ncbi:hypothetical protein JVT61DRAFT_6752 [Boletus reticuloceps]|uniref:Uncharacterized protein n=1 Tax=Boletus reticuloceps TaxID=495285 RepID=A0A8I2YK74_9AGAM|nr:hypothetical protein JVT61DRAFT_6752 [Boletus reticuloceps]